ncbi:hypothetical protein [Luteibacter aegosomatis]|uniref:hypothetical protein n=1 Tax=Luteibacter aegosomatis TaxID=2911537 RepID=UPI0031F33485
MTQDKYGIEDDPYCYDGSSILRNLLDLRDDDALANAERDLTMAAAEEMEFLLPPYSLKSLQDIHRHIFGDIYSWAGELRTVDISKGTTRFCTASRIVPESTKFFGRLAQMEWLEGLP